MQVFVELKKTLSQEFSGYAYKPIILKVIDNIITAIEGIILSSPHSIQYKKNLRSLRGELKFLIYFTITQFERNGSLNENQKTKVLLYKSHCLTTYREHAPPGIKLIFDLSQIFFDYRNGFKRIIHKLDIYHLSQVYNLFKRKNWLDDLAQTRFRKCAKDLKPHLEESDVTNFCSTYNNFNDRIIKLYQYLEWLIEQIQCKDLDLVTTIMITSKIINWYKPFIDMSNEFIIANLKTQYQTYPEQNADIANRIPDSQAPQVTANNQPLQKLPNELLLQIFLLAAKDLPTFTSILCLSKFFNISFQNNNKLWSGFLKKASISNSNFFKIKFEDSEIPHARRAWKEITKTNKALHEMIKTKDIPITTPECALM